MQTREAPDFGGLRKIKNYAFPLMLLNFRCQRISFLCKNNFLSTRNVGNEIYITK